MTVLAVDVGGTSLRAALVRRDVILHRARAATRPGPVAGQLAELIGGLLPANPDDPPEAVGVGVPEYVHAGVVTSSEVVEWTPGTVDRIRSAVAEVADAAVPWVVEADVRCGAVAEHARLEDPDRMSLLYVSWGTGLSSSFVLPGGRAWPGARGEALALGEWRDDAGRRLEDLASGRGIERAWSEASGTSLDAVAIDARARAADPVAAALFDRAGRSLGRAIRHLVEVLDPHEVVLGGGLGAADHSGRHALSAELAAVPARPGFPPVRPARGGADAGLLGAAVLAGRAAAAAA